MHIIILLLRGTMPAIPIDRYDALQLLRIASVVSQMQVADQLHCSIAGLSATLT